MHGIYFPGDRTAVLEESPDPDDVADGWAAVAVQASGICGTDLHRYRLPAAERAEARGWRTGHEATGYVCDDGLTATGQRVVVYHSWGCQQPGGPCDEARHPRSKRCPHAAVMGLNANGANGTYQVVPAEALLPLPDDLGWDDGVVLACNFPTAWTACRRANVGAGDRVLVTGLGPVGVLAAQVAAHRGADVTGLDRSAERVAWAQQHGVQATADAEALTAVGGAYDRIIETTGAPAVSASLVAALTPQGIACLVGLGDATTFGAARELVLKELQVVGSLIFVPDDWPAIVADYRSMPTRPAESVISHRTTPDDALDAFRRADRAKVTKVLFDWAA